MWERLVVHYARVAAGVSEVLVSEASGFFEMVTFSLRATGVPLI
jgi:hypothetical protein